MPSEIAIAMVDLFSADPPAEEMEVVAEEMKLAIGASLTVGGSALPTEWVSILDVQPADDLLAADGFVGNRRLSAGTAAVNVNYGVVVPYPFQLPTIPAPGMLVLPTPEGLIDLLGGGGSSGEDQGQGMGMMAAAAGGASIEEAASEAGGSGMVTIGMMVVGLYDALAICCAIYLVKAILKQRATAEMEDEGQDAANANVDWLTQSIMAANATIEDNPMIETPDAELERV